MKLGWTLDEAVVLLFFFVVFWLAWAGAQAQIATYKSEGYLPPVISVAVTTPDSARICAEREQGLTDCRSVGELRKWLRERVAMEKYLK